MSNADLGSPTHYIPVFYQQSKFIVLEPDAIVSGYKIKSNWPLLYPVPSRKSEKSHLARAKNKAHSSWS